MRGNWRRMTGSFGVKMRNCAVLFDFDGTLSDTLQLVIRSFRYAAGLWRSDLTDEMFTKNFGMNEPGILRKIVPDHAEEALKAYLKYYAEHLNESVLFPGIPKCLHELKQAGCTVVLLTGKCRESAEISLNYFGLKNLFDACYYGDSSITLKTRVMQKALLDLKIDPLKTLYIGDAASDAVAACQTGIPMIGVTWGHTETEEKLRKNGAAHVFSSVPDLHNYLKEQWLPGFNIQMENSRLV